jgi:Sigma-70, region 4
MSTPELLSPSPCELPPDGAEVLPDLGPELNADQVPDDHPPDHAIGNDPDLWLYRGRTLGLLKRYLRLSVEAGRLPSLLGRELFRARVTYYRTVTLEDAIIFVHDVERCLEQLDDLDRELIAAMIFQEHSYEEAAVRLGCGRRTIGRRFSDALDNTSELFLRGGLLRRLPQLEKEENPDLGKSCQEAKSDEILVSGSADSENKFPKCGTPPPEICYAEFR